MEGSGLREQYAKATDSTLAYSWRSNDPFQDCAQQHYSMLDTYGIDDAF